MHSWRLEKEIGLKSGFLFMPLEMKTKSRCIFGSCFQKLTSQSTFINMETNRSLRILWVSSMKQGWMFSLNWPKSPSLKKSKQKPQLKPQNNIHKKEIKILDHKYKLHSPLNIYMGININDIHGSGSDGKHRIHVIDQVN